MSRIVSSLPGRIRVRDRVLRNRARLDQLEVALRRIEAVSSVQTNPGAGSVVLFFDVARADATEFEEVVDAAVDAALAAPSPKTSVR